MGSNARIQSGPLMRFASTNRLPQKIVCNGGISVTLGAPIPDKTETVADGRIIFPGSVRFRGSFEIPLCNPREPADDGPGESFNAELFA